MLFDENDLGIAMNQAKLGYHFHEWLASVLIFHVDGLFSLNEGYQYSKHIRKRKVLSQLTDPDTIEYLERHPKHGMTQCPDLLVYKPDYSDWFFAEVKSPSDSLKDNQIRFFEELQIVSGKEVMLVKFTYLDKGQH